MPCSALANLILFEKLLEEQGDFEEELFNSALVAGTGAVFTRSMCTEIFSADVTNTVTVLVNVTRCRFGGDHGFTAKTAFGSFPVLGAGCGFIGNFGKRMDVNVERAGIGFGVFLCR